jgi:hypothetical protein
LNKGEEVARVPSLEFCRNLPHFSVGNYQCFEKGKPGDNLLNLSMDDIRVDDMRD